MDALKKQFLNPTDEFTPIPFWFLNDTLDKDTLKQQLYSFYEKSVVAKRLRSFRYMPTRAVLCCCCFKIIKEVFDNAGMRMYVLAKRTNITDDSRKKVEKATKK